MIDPMHPWRTMPVLLLLAATIVSVLACPVRAQSRSPSVEPILSPYWGPAVSRWEPIIVRCAQGRSLDPDLVAAVIWKESLGRPTARGPTGAVGLMGLMPFPWRPSPEELENPWINTFWGARALAQTIRDGRADLYYSLAAYNGGWELVHVRATRRYAADVIGHYARAIAVRHGLSVDGSWIAILAVEGARSPKTITVVGPQRPLTRYTERPWLQADTPSVPAEASPHATAVTIADEEGTARRVGLWLVAGEGSPLPSHTTQVVSHSHSLAGEVRRDAQGWESASGPLAILP